MFLVVFATHVLNCVTSISVVISFNAHSHPDAETLFVQHSLWR